MKFEFYCLANNKTGYGHLNRCISLSSSFKTNHWSSNFNILGSTDPIKLIKNTKLNRNFYISSNNLIKSTFSKETGYFKSKIVVLDITHPLMLSNKKKFIDWIKFLYLESNKLVVIDSIGSSSVNYLIKRLSFKVDLLIIPYITNLEFPKNTKIKLFGPKYFIFSDFYKKLKKRKINHKAKNILVSCGGSDPYNITLSILKNFIHAENSFNIRVIFGPLFKKSLISSVKKLKGLDKHKVKYYQSPLHLCDHMLWSDLTIATSGLTKYELALSGTPSALISIDKFHHRMNLPFSRLKSSIDLGIFKKKNSYMKKIDMILSDYNLRKNMSISGQNAIDALGTNRILKEIKNYGFK